MIQRIQTLWLLLAVLLAVLTFFFPLAIFVLPDQEIIYNLVARTPSIDTPNFFQQSSPIVLVVLNSVFILLTCVTIFLYKNRILQMKVLAFAFLVAVAYTLVLLLYQTDAGLQDILTTFLKGKQDMIETLIKSAKTTYGLGSYFCVGEILVLIFARNAIRKDEKLVRSSEHLR